VLDTVDAAIQETDAVVEKQEQVKTGLLQDLLTRGLDAEGRLRDPEREPEAFRETDLGFRPVEWDVESAGEILNGITQGWSPKCRPDPASQGQWGVLRTTSVQWSGFTEVENKALPSDLSPRPEYEVEALDVLMTRAGPASRVGVVALVEDVRGKLLLSDKLYRLEHRDDILPRFLHAALSSEKIQNLLGREKTGMAGSQTNISQRIVKDLPFPHPPIEEQKRIVSVLKEHSGHIEGEKAYRSKLQSLKNGLMQDLLTGRIRVPEAQERVDEVTA
jgi:type I restriction enzyme S subunit